jgi:uncharacterized membrane protein YbaN (DUF454 family)
MLQTAWRLFTGGVLVVVGIVGLILPIMPGWIFLIPGLVILADHLPPVRRLLNWARRQAERAGVKLPAEKSASKKPS